MILRKSRFHFFLLVILAFAIAAEATVFNFPRTIVLPRAQAAVSSGDLNEDGLPDLVVGGDPTPDSGLGKLYVFLGKGNGSLQSPQAYQVGYNDNDIYPSPFIQQIKTADMNNDGNLDVVVMHNGLRSFISNQSNNFITVLYGNGTGVLQPAQAYITTDGSFDTFATDFKLKDLNSDGFLDIVMVINVRGLAALWILRNRGDGFFQVLGRRMLGTNIWSIEAVELNGDQLVDFVMATQVGIVIGYREKGQFFPTIFEQRDLNMVERSLVAHDFNQDGRTDFAVPSTSSPEIRIFLNSSAGIPQSPIIVPTMYNGGYIVDTDLNQDGYLDLMTAADATSLDFEVFYGTATGSFDSSEIVRNDVPMSDLAFADFDQDGKLDFGFSIYDHLSATSPKAGIMLNAPNPGRYYTDFSGDRKTDHTVFRPSNGSWWQLLSDSSSYQAMQFGLSTDKIVPGNYDGDNKADIAVYRDGLWYIWQSSTNSLRVDYWGLASDMPVPADYDNDGAMNPAVFRPGEGRWYIKKDSGFDAIRWGLSEDKPVPSDYDGDGKTDIAVFRMSEGGWYVLQSTTGNLAAGRFGVSSDKPVPGDYDGDGKADLAVFRPSTGIWYIWQSNTGNVAYLPFGLSTDIPVPSDFDGDSRSDPAVFRPSDGKWYTLRSTDGSAQTIQWGTNGDIPLGVINN